MKRELAALACGRCRCRACRRRHDGPGKVLAFLDVLGNWDPTLMVVMAAAVTVALLAYRGILRRPRPLLDTLFHLPTRKDIDTRLVAGAILFGIGWGLYGYCPGPALGALVYGNTDAFLFVGAMLAGVFAEWGWRRLH